MAMPRGLALGSVSAILGKPVEEEKRTVIGVEGVLKCGAVVRSDTVALGVNVPVRRCPFACAGCTCQLEVTFGTVTRKGLSKEKVKNKEEVHTWSKTVRRATSHTAKSAHKTIARLQHLGIRRKWHDQ